MEEEDKKKQTKLSKKIQKLRHEGYPEKPMRQHLLQYFAEELGLSQVLEKAGAEFICDACTCLTPLIRKENCDSIITNSVKASYYMKTSNKISVALKDIKTIVKDYSFKL